jgi:hypothetical protein
VYHTEDGSKSFADDGCKTTAVAIVSRALHFRCPDTIDTSFDGHTALALAVQGNNRLLTEYLISMGANVNCEAPDTAITPLGQALVNATQCSIFSDLNRDLPKKAKIVVALLKAGANPHCILPEMGGGWWHLEGSESSHSKTGSENSEFVLTKLVLRLFDIHVRQGARVMAASDLRFLVAALSQPRWALRGPVVGDYASLVQAALDREERRKALAGQEANKPQVVRRGLFD